MFNIRKTDFFERKAKKFFRKQPKLLNNFQNVIGKLIDNPFQQSLKTHKLSGELKEFYACSLNYEFRIAFLFEIKDDEIILTNIGTHDEVY
jgi:addiction module RelE/StbE family toxin